jgi:hypothetical protein
MTIGHRWLMPVRSSQGRRGRCVPTVDNHCLPRPRRCSIRRNLRLSGTISHGSRLFLLRTLLVDNALTSGLCVSHHLSPSLCTVPVRGNVLLPRILPFHESQVVGLWEWINS